MRGTEDTYHHPELGVVEIERTWNNDALVFDQYDETAWVPLSTLTPSFSLLSEEAA